MAAQSAPSTRAARRGSPAPLRRAGRVAYQLVIVAVAVVISYPAVWMVLSTFKPSNQIIAQVNPIPREWTLANYETALQGIGGVPFWTYLSNSLILAVLSAIGVVLSSSVTAYAFARVRFPGRQLWFAIMIGTLLLPMHVVIIPQYIMFNQLGWVNTFIPLLIGRVLATEAFFVFLMVQFLRTIPTELDEAARIDGAGHLRTFASIILPLLRPALVTSAIFAFIWSWNDFFGPLLYLKKPGLYTLPLALRQFQDQTSISDYGAQMAMAVLALVPVVLFFLIFQRQIVDGVSTQGLKG